MEYRMLGVVTAVAVALATAVTAPAASAAPVSAAEFDAARASAVAASGAFTPGTTVTVEIALSSDLTLVSTVNPDGSLSQRVTAEGDFYDLKCVRVDRCWQREPATYKDDKWHLLPKGTVTYESLAHQWAVLTTTDWSEATRFDVTEVPDVGQVFTAVQPGASLAMSETVTVNGPRLTYVLRLADPSGKDTATFASMSVRSQAERVPVSPPRPRKVGTRAPAQETIELFINS